MKATIKLILALGFFLMGKVHAQSLMLSKSTYVMGEEVFFDLALPAEDTSSYVYIQLIDPISLETKDFQAFLIKSRIMQGDFLPDKELLATGPYLLSALTNSGQVLGMVPIHMVHGRHSELYSSLTNGLLHPSEGFKKPNDQQFLPVKIESNNKTHTIGSWAEVHAHVGQSDVQFHKLFFQNKQALMDSILLPTPKKLGLDASALLPFKDLWIYNTTANTKNYSVSWFGQELVEFDLLPSDSIAIDLTTFPLGKLALHDGNDIQWFINLPDIKTGTLESQQIKVGESLTLELPKLLNPVFQDSSVLVRLAISSQKASRSEFWDEDVKTDPVNLPYAKASIHFQGQAMKHEDFQGLVLMDSSRQFNLSVDDGFILNLTPSIIYSLSRGEGRIRLGKMDKKTEVKLAYPELNALNESIKVEIKNNLNDKKWSLPLLSISSSEALGEVGVDVLDLEEVIINAQSSEELDEAVKLHPFSEHWINTDYLCSRLVLNCEEHSPFYGNQPESVKTPRIPLHIWLQMEGSKLMDGLRSAREQFETDTRVKINNPNTQGVFTSHQLSTRGGKMYDMPSQTYSWSPEPYLKNMAKVKFFEDDLFYGLRENYVISVEDQQSGWWFYQEGMHLTLQSQYARGDYYIHITYFDLNSNLHSTISIPFEVS